MINTSKNNPTNNPTNNTKTEKEVAYLRGQRKLFIIRGLHLVFGGYFRGVRFLATNILCGKKIWGGLF